MNLGQLETMRIKTPVGEYPLSELATYNIDRGPVSIKHYNGAREIRIDADVVSYEHLLFPFRKKLKMKLSLILLSRYPGIDVAYLGQKKDSDETMAQIQKFFLPAFLLMFLIIILHFKSIAQGLIIIAMIPLSMVGSYLGPWY